MRTTVVPAQVTTVEDRIAGNLTLPQITLMVISLVVGAVIYAGIPQKMHFGTLKTTLTIIQFAILGALALRINGKIVADWLIIYSRYSTRPRRYIFTKNDLTHRDIIAEKENIKTQAEQKNISEHIVTAKPLTLLEQLNLKKIFDNDDLTISFKPSKKGGMDVSLKQKKD